MPDLPRGKYQVFVRGYGLVDSPKVGAAPGQQLNLRAVPAPDARAAAQIYPAAYWLSLMEIPKGAMPEREVLSAIKECLTCHQVGNQGTREISKALGSFPNSLAAWDHRVTVGPMGLAMSGSFQRFGEQRRMFADWTDEIAAGAVPTQVPPRPSGLERNLVVTLWDWAVPTGGRSDGAASDDRIGTNNANGPIWGVIQSDDLLVSIDPAANRAEQIVVPTQRSDDRRLQGAVAELSRSSRSGSGKSDPRSVAIDHDGRVWLTGRIRAQPMRRRSASPGSTNKFTSYFPVPRLGSRQVMLYDPKTKQFTQHRYLLRRRSQPLRRERRRDAVFRAEQHARLDRHGGLREDEERRSLAGLVPGRHRHHRRRKDYAVDRARAAARPRQGSARHLRLLLGRASTRRTASAWCAGIGPRDNKLVRIERGPNPPLTCKAEVFEPPPGHTPEIFRSGGVSVDSNGVAWLNWRGTDYFTSFDRRKCKTLNGPQATGQHCPEGWTVHIKRGPTFANTTAPNTPNNSDLLYLTHVDKHNTLGLGPDVPVSGSVNTDSLLAFVPRTNQFVQLTVPYPMGFFARSAQGRVDDARTGWKGRGFYSTYSSYIPWHYEGGKGTKPKLVKFQVRPNPLAK